MMGKNLSRQDASLVKELPEGKRLVLALVTTLCHYNSALLEMDLKTWSVTFESSGLSYCVFLRFFLLYDCWPPDRL